MKIKGYSRKDGTKVKGYTRNFYRQNTKDYKYGRTYRDRHHPKDEFTYLGKEGFSAKGHGVNKPDTWMVRRIVDED